jgi:choline-sulfatase
MSLNRRDFLKTSAGGTLLALSGGSAGAAPRRTEQPNILLIVVDQMNLDAISAYREFFKHPAYGCHWLETPSLDQLVSAGTSFIESHSADPICCPARASLFTGRMTCENGVIYNNVGIDEQIPNLGQWLGKEAGYQTVYCGKWHAGGAWNCPTVSGARKIPGFDTLPVGGRDVGRTLDYEVSTSTEAYVRNYKGARPFFMVAGLLNPHDICFWHPASSKGLTTLGRDYYRLGNSLPQLPPNQNYSFDEKGVAERNKISAGQWGDQKWKSYIYDYLRQIETLDRDVGRMLDAVRSRDDNTVVIFTSDHGDGAGRHRRCGKWNPYESPVKVPLIVCGPGIQSGVVDREHLVSGVDLFPTVCEFVGVAPPENMRGHSLVPLLRGEAPKQWRDHVYYSYQYTGRCIRTQKYKYVMRYKFSGQVSSPPDSPQVLDLPFVRKDTGEPSRFIPGRGDLFVKEPNEFLFDLENDPWEITNLAGDASHAETMAAHRQLLEDWEQKLAIGTRTDRN